jgi:hypothetical protein
MTEKPKPMIKISVETISLGFSEWIDRVAACMAFFWNSVNGHRGFMSVWVKHFQAIHQLQCDVAHGLALLFGLGTKALPSWDSKTRWNNLLGDLAVNVTAGSSGHTNSPHPSSREGHHSTVRRISGFSYLI